MNGYFTGNVFQVVGVGGLPMMCMLAQVGTRMYALIHLDTGNRFSEPVYIDLGGGPMKPPRRVKAAEISRLVNGSPHGGENTWKYMAASPEEYYTANKEGESS